MGESEITQMGTCLYNEEHEGNMIADVGNKARSYWTILDIPTRKEFGSALDPVQNTML
jgi:hypothetical protein